MRTPLLTIMSFLLACTDGSPGAPDARSEERVEAQSTPRTSDAASSPPSIDVHPVQREPNCDAVNTCLREELGRSFDPSSDMPKLKRASACLAAESAGEAYPGPGRCLAHYGSLVHAKSGRPLRLVAGLNGLGCTAREATNVRVLYQEEIDQTTCQCMGYPQFSAGIAARYASCAVADVEGWRSSLASKEHAWESFGRSPHRLQALQRGIKDPQDLQLTSVPHNVKRGGLLTFPVRLIAVNRTNPAQQVQVDYYRAKPAQIERLFPEFRLPRRPPIEKCTPLSGFFPLEMEMDERGKLDIMSSEESCEELKSWWNVLEKKMRSFPKISQCRARAQVPFGGSACWPGGADGIYVALRRRDREIRVVTEPLAEFLCAALAVVISAK